MWCWSESLRCPVTPVTKPLFSPVLRFAADIWAGPRGVCPCGLRPNQIRSPGHRSNVLWRARKAPGPGGPQTQLVLAGSWTCTENQGHFLGLLLQIYWPYCPSQGWDLHIWLIICCKAYSSFRRGFLWESQVGCKESVLLESAGWV